MTNNFAYAWFFAPILWPFILLIFAFEVWMFVHVIRNKKIDDTPKILWIIGMLLIHPFVAIAYYFTDYKKAK